MQAPAQLASPDLASLPKHCEAESWNPAAATYNDSVGPSSGLAAPPIIASAHSLSPIDDPSANLLELGAGTGSLTLALARRFPHAPLLATDISPAMLSELRAAAATAGVPAIETRVVDMTEPVTPQTPVGAFSHVFCFMALQNLPDPGAAIAQWLRLLAPGAILAVGIWDFDLPCGPYEIWHKTARAVDPKHVVTPMLPEGRWTGRRQLEKGMMERGLNDVRVEEHEVGFNIGIEGFMRFFWESGSPFPLEKRTGRSSEDVTALKKAMLVILGEEYDDGKSIPLWTALAVGRK